MNPERDQVDPSISLLGWNIRSGGGVRVSGIFKQLIKWDADILVLSEFRGTSASQSLSRWLRDAGWIDQVSTAQTNDKTNALLIASRWPVSCLEHRTRIDRFRFLPCEVNLFNGRKHLFVGGMHVPNRVSGRKQKFQQGIIRYLKQSRHAFGLLIGDTNSGLQDIDEERPVFGAMEKNWIDQLQKLCWLDAYRRAHGDARIYTWYSPNGNNGFRLDYAYLDPQTLSGLTSVSYLWGKSAESTRREVLSDHAAISLTIKI